MESTEYDEERVFQQIWERVMEGRPNPIVPKYGKKTPSSPPLSPKPEPIPPENCVPKPSEAEFLVNALLSTQACLLDYEKLEKQLPSSLKQQGTLGLHRCKEQYIQLETAYFLGTGEDSPQQSPKLHSNPLPAHLRLRHLFLQAQQWQSAYQRSAFDSQDSRLTGLYLKLELEKKEEVSALQGLLLELFSLRHR